MNSRHVSKRLSVSACNLGLGEVRGVAAAVRSQWITMGRNVRQFEEEFAAYCSVKYAVASNNGTSALHLALIAAGVREGDEVIVPDLTYIACANAVTYCRAKPVLADIDPATWCVDPAEVERKITRRTKVIMAVHLYGHPCDMSALKGSIEGRCISIIEDAAEAHGATYNGRRTGGLGVVGSFSFYGNKIITTGEGGMCTTNSRSMAETMRLYRGQGVDPQKRFWHSVVGFNYRMTDLQAAVGLAQMERLDAAVKHHRRLAKEYSRQLADSGLILPSEAEYVQHVYWLYSVVVPDCTYAKRNRIMARLQKAGIETRPIFYPVHQMPPYRRLGTDKEFPVACMIARGGISLPTHTRMTTADARAVARELIASL